MSGHLSVERPIHRWNDTRKREVLGAIAAGRVTVMAMMRLHNISPLELELWQAQFDDDGGFIGQCYGRDGDARVYA